MRGNPLTLIGPELKAGDAAPDFGVVDSGLKPVGLKETGNSVRIISIHLIVATPNQLRLGNTAALRLCRPFGEQSKPFSMSILSPGSGWLVTEPCSSWRP